MANPFGSREMAAGYAKSRPAVHPEILRLARQHLGGRAFDCALDLGCGAGLSTAPLRSMSRRTVGLEPNVSMLQWASETAPGAVFTAASAEQLPFADAAFDLIAAAGALNYVDLGAFFAEAARVSRPDGVLVVYDFSQGRSFTDGPALDEWFVEFMRRYPPPGEARDITPESLARDASAGFGVQYAERFEIPLPLTPEFLPRLRDDGNQRRRRRPRRHAARGNPPLVRRLDRRGVRRPPAQRHLPRLLRHPRPPIVDLQVAILKRPPGYRH